MGEFKNPCASAPQSCSGSSGSDDEDEDSGETEDMDHYDPSVIDVCSVFQHPDSPYGSPNIFKRQWGEYYLALGYPFIHSRRYIQKDVCS